MIGVLALQGGFSEHVSMLKRLGVDAIEVRLPDQLEDLQGLIIPGGESTTIARLLARWQLLTAIRERAQQGLAIWGTCAGAILLAKQAPDLDKEGLRLMDVTIKRNAFGRQVDSFEQPLQIKGLSGDDFPGVFIRAPLMAEVADDVDVIASLADGTIVAAQQNNLLATSFHPELTGDARMHAYFLTMAGNPCNISRDQ